MEAARKEVRKREEKKKAEFGERLRERQDISIPRQGASLATFSSLQF